MPATKKAASTKSEPAKTKTATKTATRSAAAPTTAKRAAPAARQAAMTTTATPKAETKVAPKAETKRQTTRQARIDPERRRNYVEVAAYYIAERRGFGNGDQTMDWLAAEEEIDRLLQENKLSA